MDESKRNGSTVIAVRARNGKDDDKARRLMKHPVSGLPVDSHGRATRFTFFSLVRPHMRAFHLSWMGFFLAFQGWFAFAPLMPTVKRELGLSDGDVASANIASVASTVLVRIIVGPLCDLYGARKVMAALLYVGAIPVMLGGLVDNAAGLIISRFCIGLIGGVFVPCQMWTTSMFSYNVVGTANAIVGGWGNLGASGAFLLLPAIFEAFTSGGLSDDKAWRLTMVVPGFICVCIATCIVFFSDDWPTAGLPENSGIEPPKMKAVKLSDMAKTIKNIDVIMAMLQYAACFGVELAVNNALVLYLYDHFLKDDCSPASDPTGCRKMNQSAAGQIASIFALTNLFARAMGGILSDFLSARLSLHGRLLAHAGCLLGEAVFLLLFSSTTELGPAIGVLAVFSLFTQASEGTTFALVPYINTANVGAVAGLVGAGGNIGAVAWSTTFKAYSDDPRIGFRIVGFIVLGIACLTFFLHVQSHSLVGWLCGSSRLKVHPSHEAAMVAMPPQAGAAAAAGARPERKLASSSIATAMYPHTALQAEPHIPDSTRIVTAMYPSGPAWVRLPLDAHEHSAVARWM